MKRALRHPGAVRQRRRSRPAPRISPATLAVTGETAVFRVERRLQSPNRSLWAHWRAKHRERRAWEASLKVALMQHLEAAATTRSGRVALVRGVLTGSLPPAPKQRYRVDVTRIVPYAHHRIADEDNLTFSVKPVLDALVSLGLIYDDRREWLDRPLPTQVVEAGTTATLIQIAPWWRTQPDQPGGPSAC